MLTMCTQNEHKKSANMELLCLPVVVVGTDARVVVV